MDKMVNQRGSKNHGNKAKPELCKAGTEAHRRATATVKRTRWKFCQPRGRNATSDGSRRSQATRTGLLGAQGTSGARTCFAAMAQALVRRRGLDGNDRRRWEKQSEETGTNGGGSVLITRLRSKEKPHHGLHRASTTPKMATRAPRTETKLAGDVA